MDKKRVIAAFKRKNAGVFSKKNLSYDRADWHSKTVEELGLDPLAAYLPGGMLLAWAVERGFLSAELEKEHQTVVQDYKIGLHSPAALYKIFGGVINQGTFSSEGNAFLGYYEENYLIDYLAAVERGESDYHVEDSRSNFSKVRAILDQRYAEFLE